MIRSFVPPTKWSQKDAGWNGVLYCCEQVDEVYFLLSMCSFLQRTGQKFMQVVLNICGCWPRKPQNHTKLNLDPQWFLLALYADSIWVIEWELRFIGSFSLHTYTNEESLWVTDSFRKSWPSSAEWCEVLRLGLHCESSCLLMFLSRTSCWRCTLRITWLSMCGMSTARWRASSQSVSGLTQITELRTKNTKILLFWLCSKGERSL